jgi:hypothetical protein
MKVRQVVESKFNYFYCGWGSLDFEDIGGNKITIDVTDDQILQVAEKLQDAADRINKKRAEALEEAAE